MGLSVRLREYKGFTKVYWQITIKGVQMKTVNHLSFFSSLSLFSIFFLPSRNLSPHSSLTFNSSLSIILTSILLPLLLSSSLPLSSFLLFRNLSPHSSLTFPSSLTILLTSSTLIFFLILRRMGEDCRRELLRTQIVFKTSFKPMLRFKL